MRRPDRLPLPVLVALLVLALAGRTHAQGLPMFADPVDTDALDRIAEHLDLSDQQYLALLPLHEVYRQRFAQLRTGEMLQFQDRMLDMMTGFMRPPIQIPPRADLEDLMTRYERLLDRIDAVDRTLFDDTQTILTEEQSLIVPRVRTLRRLEVRRHVVVEMTGEINRGGRVHLTHLVRQVRPGPEEMTRVEPILVEYEKRQLRHMADLQALLREAGTIVLDTIDEIGLRDMTMEEMMQVMAEEEMQLDLKHRFDESSGPLQAAAAELSELNLGTMRRLAAELEDSSAEQLRDRYHKRVSSGVYRGPGEWRARYRAAMKETATVSAELREQLGVQLDRFMDIDDRLVDELADVSEAARQYRSVDVLSGEEPSPQRPKLDELVQRREALARQADETYETLLGPELLAALEGEDDDDAEEPDAGPGETVTVMTGPDGTTTTIVQQRVEPDEQVVTPDAIGVTEVGRFAAALGWTDERRSILDSLYDDYRARYDERVAGTGAPAPDADGTAESEAGAEPSPDDTVAELAALDESFFDDLDVIDAEAGPRLELLRRQRRRVVQHELSRKLGRRAWPREGGVDLAAIILEVNPAVVGTAARPALEQYGTDVAPLLAGRLGHARDLHRRSRMISRIREEGGSAAQGMAERLEEKQRESRGAVWEADRAIADLNQRSLDEILGVLETDAARRLRDQYHRAVYPDLYREARRVEKILDEVSGLPDLSEGQQESLTEIGADFRGRYRALSDRMVELQSGRNRRGFDMPRREDIEDEIELEEIRFERRELCARAKLRVRLTLTEDQAHAVEGLLEG